MLRCCPGQFLGINKQSQPTSLRPLLCQREDDSGEQLSIILNTDIIGYISQHSTSKCKSVFGKTRI